MKLIAALMVSSVALFGAFVVGLDLGRDDGVTRAQCAGSWICVGTNEPAKVVVACRPDTGCDSVVVDLTAGKVVEMSPRMSTEEAAVIERLRWELKTCEKARKRKR